MNPIAGGPIFPSIRASSRFTSMYVDLRASPALGQLLVVGNQLVIEAALLQLEFRLPLQ